MPTYPASAPPVPDLPPTPEQFQALFRLAYGVHHVDPEHATQAAMVDHLAANLSDRLRLFQPVVEEEEDRFEPGTYYLGVEPPRNGPEIVDRCRHVANLVEQDQNLQ